MTLSTERKEHWKIMITRVKTFHDICSSTFDDCKTTVDQHKKIKTWISKYNAIEVHDGILGRTQVDEKYQTCGEWLIDSNSFQSWASTGTPKSTSAFWIRGTGECSTTYSCHFANSS
jgi:hypothetical protein